VQDKQEVVIEKIVRNKRKCVTVVKGLELFGELSSSLNKICMSEMAWHNGRISCYIDAAFAV
jgi:translation initiation factor 1 (eIF-1/SUI1)